MAKKSATNASPKAKKTSKAAAKSASGGVAKVKREKGTRKPSEFEIKDPSLKMIGKAGGNPSVSADTPFVMRKTGQKWMEAVLRASGRFMLNSGRSTLSVEHVKSGIEAHEGQKVM